MTADVASLVLEVDSREVADGGRELDRLSEKAGKAQRATELFGAAVRTMGTVLAAQQLAAFGAASLRAASEASAASAKLDAVLKATRSAAGLTKQSLDEMADSMAKSTVFDDESIRNASAVLLTFRNVQGETFKQGIRLATDMSVILGSDLNGAVMQVGKALNEPVSGITALNRAGVQFSETQKQQIKYFSETNQLAKAQKIVLGELESQVGDAAEEINTGLTKAIKDLSKEWGEFQELAGKKFEEGGGSFFITRLTEQVQKLKLELGGGEGSIRKFISDLMNPTRPGIGQVKSGWSMIDPKFGIGGPAEEETARAVAKAGEEAQKAAQKADALAVKNTEAATAYAKVTKAAKDFTDGLNNEAAQIGLSTEARKILEAEVVAMTLRTDKERDAVRKSAIEWARKALALADAEKATAQARESELAMDAATRANTASVANHVLQVEQEFENYGLLRSQIEAIIIAKLEEQRTIAAGWDGQEVVLANLEKEIALRKRALAAMHGIEERDAMKKASEESAREWAKFADQVEQSLTDALYRSFEAGGNFGETFARNLERTFKTMALKYAIQYVVSYAGGAASQFVNGATGGAMGNAGGMAGQLGSTLVSEGGKWVYNNGGSYVSSLFGSGAAVGSYAGAGTGLAASSSSGGLASSVYGSSMANATPAVGNATAGASGTSWLPIIGWIIAGMTASNALSKAGYGYGGEVYSDLGDKTRGLNDQSVGNTLARLFSKIGIDGRTSDILSAAPIDNNAMAWLFDEDFMNAGSGLELGIRGGKLASGQNYQDWWSGGGRFHGSEQGTNYSGLSGDQSSTIQVMLDSVTEGFIEPFNEAFATGVALNFDFRAGGEGFFKAIEAQLVKGIAESDVGSLFVGITEASGMMAAMQTFAAVQSQLATLGLTTDLKSAGTLAVGVGSDKLQAGMGSYYEAFFSDQERATNQAAGVNSALTGLLGTSAPKTKEEFRKAVESLDLATESGRNMFASLMGLAPAFSTMIDNLDVAAGGMGRFTASLIALRESLYIGEDSGLSASARYSTAKGALSSATAETMGGAVKEFLDASRGVARTSLDYARDRALADATISSVIPKFAAGGSHPGGVRVVGENGPEIEFTGPSRIASNSQSKALLDNSEVVAELRAMRAELAALRASSQSTAESSKRTMTVLRKVTLDGNSLLTTPA